MKMAAIVILAIAISPIAHATQILPPELDSGMTICNAGISHPEMPSQCVSATKGACSQNTQSTNYASDCICNSVNGNVGDSMIASELTQSGDVVEQKLEPESGSSFFPQSSYESDQQISALAVNLGSESYGASYWVDICWDLGIYNPKSLPAQYQIDYPSTAHSMLTAQLQFSDLSSPSISYEQDSALEVQVSYSCSGMNVADYIHGSSESAPLLTGQTPFIGASGSLLSPYINQAITFSSEVATHCQVRYLFKETSTASRSVASQNASFSLLSTITEPQILIIPGQNH